MHFFPSVQKMWKKCLKFKVVWYKWWFGRTYAVRQSVFTRQSTVDSGAV